MESQDAQRDRSDERDRRKRLVIDEEIKDIDALVEKYGQDGLLCYMRGLIIKDEIDGKPHVDIKDTGFRGIEFYEPILRHAISRAREYEDENPDLAQLADTIETRLESMLGAHSGVEAVYALGTREE